MAEIQVDKIKVDIREDSFTCGVQSIDEMIYNSYYPTVLQHAYAFEIVIGKNIVGYYMLNFLRVPLKNCPEDISEYSSCLYEECYSVHIKYIAINSKFQNKRIGTNVLRIIIKGIKDISDLLPIRLITLDALKEKYKWYTDNGFQAFNEEDLKDDKSATIRMCIDCLDINLFNAYIETQC